MILQLKVYYTYVIITLTGKSIHLPNFFADYFDLAICQILTLPNILTIIGSGMCGAIVAQPDFMSAPLNFNFYYKMFSFK